MPENGLKKRHRVSHIYLYKKLGFYSSFLRLCYFDTAILFVIPAKAGIVKREKEKRSKIPSQAEDDDCS